jgi:hypothetical protein
LTAKRRRPRSGVPSELATLDEGAIELNDPPVRLEVEPIGAGADLAT